MGNSTAGMWQLYNKYYRMSGRNKNEEHVQSSEEMITSGRMEGGQTSRKGPLDSDKGKK